MKVFINELSIVGQATNQDDAMHILSELAALAARARNISFGNKAYRTRTLGHKLITGNLSVKEVLVASSERGLAIDERQRKLAIEVFLKQPYAENYHTQPHDTINDHVGTCLKDSCFDDAASSIGAPLTISARTCPSYQFSSTTIFSSLCGAKTVLNVVDDSSLDSILWVFEHNPKHKVKEYRAAGELVSVMDLSPADAQLALSNGIKINARVYSYFNGSWYQFHCHQGNIYHGFKIELEQNNPDHMRALAISTSLAHAPYGQIFV
ncbi:hypothetical protein [Kosakonia sacchari]|uniref:hypothetical protein n=1 Tax=Kosakonia sacchari TaxID=1158459 RepID=UPI00158534BC|nr:hypothetical protein [Kosakonia sacchari]NUL37173.1 hypothetical protein [Kosakonia sacchari]